MSGVELVLASGQVTVRIAEMASRRGVELDLVANANPLATLTAAMSPAETVAVAVGLLRAVGIGERHTHVSREAVTVTIPRVLDEGCVLIPDQPGSGGGRDAQGPG